MVAVDGASFAGRQGRIAYKLLWCISIATLGVIGVWSVSRARLLSNQGWLMRCNDPPTMVVKEEDPSRARGLLSAMGPETYFALSDCGTAKLDPEQWMKLPVKRISANKIFIHARNIRGGPDRLVVVGVRTLQATYSDGATYYRSVLWQVISPGTFFRNPAVVQGTPLNGGDPCPIEGHEPIRLFAGQADPVDSAHFTVAYEVGKKRGILDGWLQPDDTVRVSVRGAVPAAGNSR